MLSLTHLSILIFTIYFVYTQTRFGWTKDISSTYYKLEDKGWLFQVTLLLLCGLMMIPLMELRESNFKLFEFLTVAGVAFVAVAPSFKLELEGTVHKVGAIVSGVSSIVVATMVGLWFIPISLLSIGLLIAAKKDKLVLWIETVLIVALFLVVLLAS